MWETTPANCQKSINFMFFEAGVDTFFLLGSLQTNTHFQTLVVTLKSICLSLCSRKPSQNAQSIELFTAEAESVHVSTYLEQKKGQIVQRCPLLLKTEGRKDQHWNPFDWLPHKYLQLHPCLYLFSSSVFFKLPHPSSAWLANPKKRFVHSLYSMNKVMKSIFLICHLTSTF